MDPVPFARVLGIDAILKGQNGVIRRDQALAAGLTRARVDDLVRRAQWVRLFPRVFLTTAGPVGARARVRACWLWAGDNSAIAGSAAAWWLGLEPQPPATITVIVPPPWRRDPQPGVRLVRGRIDPRDVDFEDWIRGTRRAGWPLLAWALARLVGVDRVVPEGTLQPGEPVPESGGMWPQVR